MNDALNDSKSPIRYSPYDKIKQHKINRIRNLIAFWVLGLCNNYPYVIMLTAAFDILDKGFHEESEEKESVHKANSTNSTSRRCNSVSTGAILLADILPTLIIKLIGPFIMINTHFRVLIIISLSALSFLITSFSVANWMSYLGVVCASASSGLGEITFLAFSSFFDKDVVSTWSSGTGGAGVIGALSYTSLTYVLKPRQTLQVMLIFPILMALVFWWLIVHPPVTQLSFNCLGCSRERDPILRETDDVNEKKHQNQRRFTFREKLSLVKPLLKFMIPLSLVYFAEYFINQGLMELLYFSNASSWLNHKQQYRWYQVDYQIGVLISRSSVNFIRIQRLWILPILQFINVIFLFFEAYYVFLPSIWIVLAIILYEGLLGGGAYVNTFYRISEEIPEEHREFSMGVASVGDSMGIALAGALALPVHNSLCRILPL